MTVPTQKITILKNGVGVTQPTASAILVLAPGDSETSSGVISQISGIQAAINLYGYTPVSELAGYISKYAGQCFALDLPASFTEATDDTMTKVGTGASGITIDGYATNSYDVVITVGTDGVSYVFSLDGGITTSKVRRITTGGSFLLPGTGLTITFGTSTGYIAGDTYSYQAIGPKLSPSDLADAFAVIKEFNIEFYAVVVYDGKRTFGDSLSLTTALGAELAALEAINYYMLGITGYGELSTTADTRTSLEAWQNNRISVVPATGTIFSALSREGYSGLNESLIYTYASRVARCLLSEDPGQVDRGALDGIIAIDNDESINATFDAWQGVTARKFRGKTGYYVTNSFMKGDLGEDVQYIQHRRVIDAACALVFVTCTNWIKRPTRTNKDGTIFETDAQTYEGMVNSAVENALIKVKNSAGTSGHISGYKYQIDRTVNLLQTKRIVAVLSVQPLGYPDFIDTTISFVATLA
jgi:hypothetical protein